MGCEFYSERERVSKKQHRCSLCGVIIPVNTKYVAVSGKWDGDFSYSKNHLECDAEYKRQNYNNDCDEEWGFFGGYSREDIDIKTWVNNMQSKYSGGLNERT